MVKPREDTSTPDVDSEHHQVRDLWGMGRVRESPKGYARDRVSRGKKTSETGLSSLKVVLKSEGQRRSGTSRRWPWTGGSSRLSIFSFFYYPLSGGTKSFKTQEVLDDWHKRKNSWDHQRNIWNVPQKVHSSPSSITLVFRDKWKFIQTKNNVLWRFVDLKFRIKIFEDSYFPWYV